METGVVFDIQRYSIHDGPGIRTIVFLKGCPLRCLWCSNPESYRAEPQLVWRADRCIGCMACIPACPNAALSAGPAGEILIDSALCRRCGDCLESCYPGALFRYGDVMTVEQVMAQVRRDMSFYRNSGGGITLSGGECTMQPKFALALLRACRAEGIGTAIETSGHCGWAVLESLLPWVDMFLYDLKVMDGARHRELTGVDNKLILENLERLYGAGARVTVRTPLIPGVNDDRGNGETMAAFLSPFPGARVELLPYHALGAGKYKLLGLDYAMAGRRPPDEKVLARFAGYFPDSVRVDYTPPAW